MLLQHPRVPRTASRLTPWLQRQITSSAHAKGRAPRPQEPDLSFPNRETASSAPRGMAQDAEARNTEHITAEPNLSFSLFQAVLVFVRNGR